MSDYVIAANILSIPYHPQPTFVLKLNHTNPILATHTHTGGSNNAFPKHTLEIVNSIVVVLSLTIEDFPIKTISLFSSLCVSV